MTVVETAAGELAAARKKQVRRRIDGALVVGGIVVLQLAWLAAIAYGAYSLVF